MYWFNIACLLSLLSSLYPLYVVPLLSTLSTRYPRLVLYSILNSPILYQSTEYAQGSAAMRRSGQVRIHLELWLGKETTTASAGRNRIRLNAEQ